MSTSDTIGIVYFMSKQKNTHKIRLKIDIAENAPSQIYIIKHNGSKSVIDSGCSEYRLSYIFVPRFQSFKTVCTTSIQVDSKKIKIKEENKRATLYYLRDNS